MYIGLMLLGRQKYRKQSPQCLIPVPLEVEIATDKLKRHKSPGTDPILAELIKAGGRTIYYGTINLLILCGIRRN
jgi:hypothetical protein